MKAWQLPRHGEPEKVLERVEVDPPSPIPGNLVVEVDAVALSLPDALMCRGGYAFKPPLPLVLGQEFTGRVRACASDVTEFRPGDRVAGVSAFYAGQGCFADACLAMETSVYPMDASVPDEQAAGFVIAFHTGYVALVTRAGLAAGETLLVSGAAGGTGAAAVQLGKALGARVIAVASSDAKIAVCERLGADVVVDSRKGPFTEAVREATNGEGVDVVYDPVGGEFYEACFSVARFGARILPIGFASGRWGNTPLGAMVQKNLSVLGTIPSGFPRETMLAGHRRLLEWLASGRIACLIDEVVGFDEIPRGLQRVADRATMGRVIARVRA